METLDLYVTTKIKKKTKKKGKRKYARPVSATLITMPSL